MRVEATRPLKASVLDTPESGGAIVQMRQLRAMTVRKIAIRIHPAVHMDNKAPVSVAIDYSLVTFLSSK
jgi:hypothetical protein